MSRESAPISIAEQQVGRQHALAKVVDLVHRVPLTPQVLINETVLAPFYWLKDKKFTPIASKPITPDAIEIVQAVTTLGLEKQFDVVLTIIGGAEFMHGPQANTQILSAYNNTINALIAVGAYLADRHKHVCVVRNPSNQGSMIIPTLMRLLNQAPNFRYSKIAQLGVYPPLVMYTGRNGAVTPGEYQKDLISGKPLLARLDKQREQRIPVTLSKKHRLDPSAPTYADDVHAEWIAAADVLTSVSQQMIKDHGRAVTVLFNGGNVAVHEVANKLKAGEKVIVVKHSGRLADVLASLKEGETPESSLYTALKQELPVENGDYLENIVVVNPLSQRTVMNTEPMTPGKQEVDEFCEVQEVPNWTALLPGIPMNPARSRVYAEQISLAEAILNAIEQ